jgi:putative membrane protein
MYLWVKAFHIVFIASWFAGLFYLPRIFVNLAEETNPAARARLLGMGRRLFRFTTMLALPALLLGLWLMASASRAAGCMPSLRWWYW